MILKIANNNFLCLNIRGNHTEKVLLRAFSRWDSGGKQSMFFLNPSFLGSWIWEKIIGDIATVTKGMPSCQFPKCVRSGCRMRSSFITTDIPALEIVERPRENVLVEKWATHCWLLTLLRTWGGWCPVGDTLLLLFRSNLAVLSGTLWSHFETGVMGGWPDPWGESMEGRRDRSLARKLSTFHTVGNSVVFLIKINHTVAINIS